MCDRSGIVFHIVPVNELNKIISKEPCIEGPNGVNR